MRTFFKIFGISAALVAASSAHADDLATFDPLVKASVESVLDSLSVQGDEGFGPRIRPGRFSLQLDRFQRQAGDFQQSMVQVRVKQRDANGNIVKDASGKAVLQTINVAANFPLSVGVLRQIFAQQGVSSGGWDPFQGLGDQVTFESTESLATQPGIHSVESVDNG